MTIQCSSIYESKAVGFVGNNFYNLGLNAKTDLSIAAINQYLRQIEHRQGRQRYNKKFCARLIDLDLVLYGNIISKKNNIPRDDILKYSFVLAPIVELMPKHKHPLKHLSYQRLWRMYDLQPLLKKHSIGLLEGKIADNFI